MSIDTWIATGIGTGGAIGGIFIGYYLTIGNEKRKNDEMLKKIKYLINADFTLANRTVQYAKSNCESMIQAFINGQSALHYTSSLDLMKEVIVGLSFRVGLFTYWDTIMASGSLISLNPDELRFITTTHTSITKIRNQSEESHQKFSFDILNRLFAQQLSNQQRAQILKQQLQIHFPNLLEACNIIQNHLKLLSENVPWIDLQAEPIQELRNSQQKPPNTSQNTPIVRSDGVTVYPDGTEVDRKGTILRFGSNYR